MNQSATALVEALRRLATELGDVVREVVAGDAVRAMTDADILALASVAESLGRPADVVRLVVAGEVDDRSRPERGEARLSARNGCANAAELLIRLTGASTATAKDRMRMAGAVVTTTTLSGETLPARFPEVRGALGGGVIGIDSATAIIRTLSPIADRVGVADIRAAEHELVAAATGTSLDDAPPVGADETLLQAKVWALVLDPDGTLHAYERAMRKRGITFRRQVDGLIPIHGMLVPDVAEQFLRLVHAHLSPRVDDRTLQTGPAFVDDATAHGPVVPTDLRSYAQKQHDVFASVLAVAARAAETPTLGGAAPTLLVTIAAADLERHDGVAFVDGTDTTVPAFVARQIACCGGYQHVVFGDGGRILELGSPQRVFTPHQRRAIIARDGGCIIPGCHVPAAWCEIHHDTEWARGGPTHTDNGLALCWHHHRTLETSGWHVRMIDGVPHTKAPYEMDPYVKWRPATGSLHRQRERHRQQVASA